MRQIRLALFGASGAGKSTSTEILVREFRACDFEVRVLKLAEPLYQVQRLVYAMAGKPLPDLYQQDGKLLSAVGETFRRITPDFLTGDFASRMSQVTNVAHDVAVICDDMRAPDVPALDALGFDMVRVSAPDEVRWARRAGRGDLSPISDAHSAEASVAIPSAFEIVNDSSRADLQLKVEELVRAVLSGPAPANGMEVTTGDGP